MYQAVHRIQCCNDCYAYASTITTMKQSEQYHSFLASTGTFSFASSPLCAGGSCATVAVAACCAALRAASRALTCLNFSPRRLPPGADAACTNTVHTQQYIINKHHLCRCGRLFLLPTRVQVAP